jgi:large subunit ribosomal protein L25
MREIQEFSVSLRSGTGKGPAYQARLKGLIPAIVYGGNEEPENITLDAHALTVSLEKGSFLTTLFHLKNGAKVTRVIPRDIQRDPVTDRAVHVDFMRLPEGATVRLAVPVRFKGNEVSPGIKRGGVLNIVSHTIELICPAEHIPDCILADVSQMDIHDTLHISHVSLPEGARTVIKDKDITLASIVAPTHVIEEARAAAAAAAAAASAPAAEEAAAAPAAAAGAAAAGAKAPAAGAKAPAAGAKAPAAGAKAAEAPKKK